MEGYQDTDTVSDASPGGDTDTNDNVGVGCSSMDILFIIDDSDSMKQEQDNLINNFPKFVEVLEAYRTPNGKQIAYRLGVTTTGVTRNFTQKSSGIGLPRSSSGPDGQLLNQSVCGLDEPWIDGPGSEVEGDFSCVANVGIDGSTKEMPMAAMQEALGTQGEPGGPNDGFYRRSSDSLLVIVIITDEDDCSVENGGTIIIPLDPDYNCGGPDDPNLYGIESTKLWLDQLTGGEGRYVVVGIAGKEECKSSFGDANHARRIEAFADVCGEFGFMGDICAGDLWVSLKEALDVMKVTCDDMPPAV